MLIFAFLVHFSTPWKSADNDTQKKNDVNKLKIKNYLSKDHPAKDMLQNEESKIYLEGFHGCCSFLH